jgi:hypothetical protein
MMTVAAEVAATVIIALVQSVNSEDVSSTQGVLGKGARSTASGHGQVAVQIRIKVDQTKCVATLVGCDAFEAETVSAARPAVADYPFGLILVETDVRFRHWSGRRVGASDAKGVGIGEILEVGDARAAEELTAVASSRNAISASDCAVVDSLEPDREERLHPAVVVDAGDGSAAVLNCARCL